MLGEGAGGEGVMAIVCQLHQMSDVGYFRFGSNHRKVL